MSEGPEGEKQSKSMHKKEWFLIHFHFLPDIELMASMYDHYTVIKLFRRYS